MYHKVALGESEVKHGAREVKPCALLLHCMSSVLLRVIQNPCRVKDGASWVKLCAYCAPLYSALVKQQYLRLDEFLESQPLTWSKVALKSCSPVFLVST